MPKQGLTEILCVIDKSGSMQVLTNDVIGGFNRFLVDQKACPGEARLTLTLFDTAYTMPHKSKPVADVPNLDDKSYIPGGCTALLDAIGRTITEAGADFAARPEDQKPEKVVVLIMTDGQENSSKEHKKEVIRQMIERQQKDWNWQFVFIGANQDSFAEAGQLGISANLIANMAATSQGTKAAYAGVSANLCAYRTGNERSMNLSLHDYK